MFLGCIFVPGLYLFQFNFLLNNCFKCFKNVIIYRQSDYWGIRFGAIYLKFVWVVHVTDSSGVGELTAELVTISSGS